MLRALIVAAFLALACTAGAQSEGASNAPADDPGPERATNRKIRQMSELNQQRREDAAEDAAQGEGVYTDHSLPEKTQPGREKRGYYSSSGGVTPSNPGGNAFGNKAGSAYPSDGGRAFPTTPNNR